MSGASSRVILCARSYNDLDCRLPLIYEFANKHKLSTSILIIPTRSGSGLNVKHPYAERLGIPVNYVSTQFTSGLLALFITVASRFIEQSKLDILRYKIWGWLWRKIYAALQSGAELKRHFTDFTDGAIIIIDDVLATPSRAFAAAWIVENASAKVYCLSHGQNTYLNLWHDIKKDVAENKDIRLKIFVPSEIDRNILSAQYPNSKVVTIGNTRFDRDWIAIHQQKVIGEREAFNFFSGTKIAFMMSKMEYGLEAEEVIRLINRVAVRPNTRIVIKPHTRGMSLDQYKKQLHASVSIGEDISSSEIIDWADIVMFTGSSIIFEAMVKKKKVLYLAALQKYRAIFDELPAISILRPEDEFEAALARLENDHYDDDVIDGFLAEHTHNKIPGGAVCSEFAKYVMSETKR
jgi:hypothetical protein